MVDMVDMVDMTSGHPTTVGIAPAGYRLPAGTSIGAVRLQVSDIGRSTDYYERVIGLHVQQRSRTLVTLGVGAGSASLVVLETREGVRPAARRATLGLYHFAILLPDRASLGRFLAHLSAIGAYAGMSDHLVSEALYLSDPDGLGIEVYADRPRETWTYDGRQLAMATNPLNAGDLIAAGGGVAWDGAPEGTVIGHVHLHVGDLAGAEAFYHSALGFDKTVWEYPGALFLSAGGYHHHLGTNTWAPGPVPPADQARLLYWELFVPRDGDAAAAAHSLSRAGYSAAEIPGGWSATDPWGTTVHILDATARR